VESCSVYIVTTAL